MNLKITFNNDINTSVQIGDTIYYAVIENGIMGEPSPRSGMKLYDITSNALYVTTSAGTVIPPNSFILFSKKNEINESSVKGYYADVTLENHSRKRAELFAVSSEIAPSSK